ncbi:MULTISPECIES: helix-turn-helix domain-containing protein [Nitrospirillum]|uniref:AraC family transcriptional regulator n=1 Tax=Nitrospirillum amazonense TaxID=28077 RepID=A0A560FVP6_9PROT|nr:AraC family transcriptional regulator [Nitrospirillum amazonense]TWB18358.1 AraC family transcriptional regulator [Nitrospirillum amazonense]TWB25715.1 AraC family transcriptional regulator [Nitrospirillum amazonense]TWB66121.1 AraC family transcriptional regulator [Nitrospirillum amazonense]
MATDGKRQSDGPKMVSPIPYSVDAALALGEGTFEVQTYRQPSPFEGEFEADAHTLSMSLTPEVRFSRCSFLDATGKPGAWAPVGDVIFVPRGARLRVEAPGGAEQYRGLYCMFPSPWFEQASGLSGPWSERQISAAIDIRAPTIRRDLYRLLKELTEAQPGRERLVATLAEVSLIELGRYLGDAGRDEMLAESALAGWQLRRLTNYVEGMVDHHPPLKELAALCEISPRHLSRAFKASTGRRIGDFVADVRMAKAKSLLCDTDLTLKEIAHRLGYSGPSSFCVAFGRAIGMTPKQYMKRHKRG